MQEKAKISETEKVLQTQIHQLSASLEKIIACSTNQQTTYEIQ